MPHGESWFSVLFANLYAWAQRQAHHLGWPFNHEGHGWILGSHIGVQHVFGALLVLGVIAWLALRGARSLRETSTAVLPEDRMTARTFVEIYVEAAYGLLKDIMGEKEARYFLPLIGTCGLFILISNALGLVPGLLPPTDNVNTTAACALIIFITTHIYGVKAHGIAYFKHFFGPIQNIFAIPLMLIMLFVEIISHLARPLSLSLRLMANISADHAVVGVFHGLQPWLVPMVVMALGTIVVVVQALVFCVLSAVYISMAVAHEEH